VNSVLVDTGAWIALLSRTDQHAAAASKRYGTHSAEGTRLVTTNYIIDETATRLRYGAGLDAALGFRRMLDESVQGRRLKITWVDETIEREAWRVLEQYRDISLSLTDATTAVAARRARITEVFGFDRDFEALGLLVLPGAPRK
jgi:predicted nucleic acid-binding protein